MAMSAEIIPFPLSRQKDPRLADGTDIRTIVTTALTDFPDRPQRYIKAERDAYRSYLWVAGVDKAMRERAIADFDEAVRAMLPEPEPKVRRNRCRL